LADNFRHFDRTGAAYFPGYRAAPAGANLIHVTHFDAPNFVELPGPSHVGLEFCVVDHTSFAADWPIRPDLGAVVAGFRRAAAMTQAAFAEAINVSRVSVERWEGGKAKPFRGDALSLLSALRPLAKCPLTGGQLLNAAAAVVCPQLRRPTATYTGAYIQNLLDQSRQRHGDLAPNLIAALIESKILAPVDDRNENDLDAEYIALAGVVAADRTSDAAFADVIRVARTLSPSDRQLWLDLGDRLSARGR